MNELFKRGKKFFTNYNWQKHIPYINQVDQIRKLKKERDDYKEAADNLLKRLNEANTILSLRQIVGEGIHPNHPHNYRNETEYPHPIFGIRVDNDGDYDEADERKPTFINNVLYPSIDLDFRKLIEETKTSNEEEALSEFDKTRLGEAQFIQESGLGHPAWTLTNKNIVMAEVEKKRPITLYPELNIKETIKVKSKRVLGEGWAEDAFEYRDLPENVEYALVKRYDNGRMKVEYYNNEDRLLNPSIEEKDIMR